VDASPEASCGSSGTGEFIIAATADIAAVAALCAGTTVRNTGVSFPVGC
jgi:hypothetical protein